MGLELELNLPKRLVLFLFLIRAEYVFVSFGATNDEILLMAFYLKPDFIDVSIKT